MGRAAQLILVLVGVSAILTGCVERKLTIKSKPADARLYVDYDEKGRTPVETHFTHYGTRSVRLEKSGYKTRVVNVDLSPTWYSYFPINFVTEVLLPFTIVDHRIREFELTPYKVPANKDESSDTNKRETMLERAEELRRQHPQASSDEKSNDSSDE